MRLDPWYWPSSFARRMWLSLVIFFSCVRMSDDDLEQVHDIVRGDI